MTTSHESDSRRVKRPHLPWAEYDRKSNAKRSQEKQAAWRGVCDHCGGPTSRRDVHRCSNCRKQGR